MMIKDYLELNHFNWIYIKENQEIYEYNQEELLNKVDESDIEAA